MKKQLKRTPLKPCSFIPRPSLEKPTQTRSGSARARSAPARVLRGARSAAASQRSRSPGDRGDRPPRPRSLRARRANRALGAHQRSRRSEECHPHKAPGVPGHEWKEVLGAPDAPHRRCSLDGRRQATQTCLVILVLTRFCLFGF